MLDDSSLALKSHVFDCEYDVTSRYGAHVAGLAACDKYDSIEKLNFNLLINN